MEGSEVDDEKIVSELKGNTLRVYWHLLRSSSGTVGVKETQKALGFSSPALATYHLRNLEDLGLVKEEGGEYRLREQMPTTKFKVQKKEERYIRACAHVSSGRFELLFNHAFYSGKTEKREVTVI